MSTSDGDTLRRILDRLKQGSALIKRKRDGEKYLRQFFLNEEEEFISYQHTDKVSGKARCYHIRDMNEVRLGFRTATFDRLRRKNRLTEDEECLAFSIIYNNYRDELHLMVDDQELREHWVQGLQHLIGIHSRKRQRHLLNDQKWISSHLRSLDLDHSNTLSKSECRRFLTDFLNVELDGRVFESLFHEADRNGDHQLTSDEFIYFFHLITRRQDLYGIMQKYVKYEDEQTMENIVMTVDELLYFLHNVQNQSVVKLDPTTDADSFDIETIRTREQVQHLIDEYEPKLELQQQHQLSLDGFQNLLLSDEFSLMKPWCAQHVYQDMTRPLSDYYINTSHNSYLFDNQVVGDSNPEAYNRALRAGCRSVEIDCHDGDNGRPIVKHGFTLVKSCLFETILRMIEPHLFIASPYPVILDLENHCSAEQQKEMAKALIKTFGDRLVIEPMSTANGSKLPSPEELKYKVLLRGLKAPSLMTVSSLFSHNPMRGDESEIDTANKVVEKRLGDLFVYLQNVPYRPENKKYNYCHSSSLSERQFNRVIALDPVGLIENSRQCILRMYPDGLRQDSSNPDPIVPWNFGMQLVAVNHQTRDDPMSLYQGKFRDNGACGYVLKPAYLRENSPYAGRFNPLDYPSPFSGAKIDLRQRLTITVISAQFLSRSKQDRNDIPDPYVVVSTHGVPCDCQVKKTRFLQNNGLNPIWNETFRFEIDFPQLCLIRFDVYDYDVFSRDDRLAYFSLPVKTIQPGYRHVQLKSIDHQPTYSTLFVHVTVEE